MLLKLGRNESTLTDASDLENRRSEANFAADHIFRGGARIMLTQIRNGDDCFKKIFVKFYI